MHPRSIPGALVSASSSSAGEEPRFYFLLKSRPVVSPSLDSTNSKPFFSYADSSPADPDGRASFSVLSDAISDTSDGKLSVLSSSDTSSGVYTDIVGSVPEVGYTLITGLPFNRVMG